MNEARRLTWLDQEDALVAANVRKYGVHLVYEANRFYQRPAEASVPVYQLSYDDKAGRFPWEAGYAAPDRQPRPGTFRA